MDEWDDIVEVALLLFECENCEIDEMMIVRAKRCVDLETWKVLSWPEADRTRRKLGHQNCIALTLEDNIGPEIL